MDAAFEAIQLPRRRIMADLDKRREWQGSSAQRELASALLTRTWNHCSSHDYIRVLPHLVGEWLLPPHLLQHFADQLAPMHVDVAAPRRFILYLFGRRSAKALSCRLVPNVARHQASIATRDQLTALLAALRLGPAPSYQPQLAASLAYWIGLHPVYIWQEALISHEMFLTLGWLGLSRRRDGAWMPAAVAEYLFDVIEIDASGEYHVTEPLVAEVMDSQEIRMAVAGAVESRLRYDEAFLRWPRPTSDVGQAQR